MNSKETVPYFVSSSLHFYKGAMKCVAYVDALLHVVVWLVVAFLEFWHVRNVEWHLDNMNYTEPGTGHMHSYRDAMSKKNYDGYESISYGAIWTLGISVLFVVLLLFAHMGMPKDSEGYSRGLEEGSIPAILIGIIQGGVVCSLIFNILSQIVFLNEERFQEWVGNPMILTALVIMKVYGISIFNANLDFAARFNARVKEVNKPFKKPLITGA